VGDHELQLTVPRRQQEGDLSQMTETLMPGGGVTRRPLHFIVMADCSGSMEGAKMRALNYALASNMLSHLITWERDQLQAQILIRILKFATVPEWHIAAPLPVADVIAGWRDLEHVTRGKTNMGPAFREVAKALSPDKLERRALRPAILLITDGLNTDPPGEFEAGLAALTGSPAGRSSMRVALAIGSDAVSDALDSFRSPDMPILVGDTDDIVDRLVVASIAVSRMAETGADRQALVQTLLHPPADLGPDRNKSIL
jgi:uncharacterized protein YegL